MLIYPPHCRLPPPSLFKMWPFSDGQGNFDPLRRLWSETPFNRSSPIEFKLILSLATTALRWDPESTLKLLRAARVADSQRSWKRFLMLTISASDLLLMGCAPTFLRGGSGGAGAGSCTLGRWSLLDLKWWHLFFNYLVLLSCLYQSGFCWGRVWLFYFNVSLSLSLSGILATVPPRRCAGHIRADEVIE